ncbi:MAG: hypothetical protein MRY64_01185 [Hyphomonadaceae bacterium]|nr:hypothetical protein [Hyphomonadaceae bacterium]
MTINTPSRSHVLVTLGALFTLGGATRFVFANLATAEGATPAVLESVAAEPLDYTTASSPADGPDISQVCFTDEAAARLEEDKWLFESAETELRQERLELETWQLELENQAAELQALQQTLDARWQQMQASADQDMLHLSEMYGAMKADEAAKIFNQMDAGFAAGFLRLLPSEQAGQIMAGMETEKAYVVSVRLASMNRDIRDAGPVQTATN